MKKTITSLGIIICLGFMQNVFGQTNTYTTSGSEIIFSWGELEYTDAFKADFPQASVVKQPVRFTVFFHFQQFFHLDLNNNIGFFTGIGMRNIGMISDETLPENYQGDSNNATYFDAKIIRRTYSLGVPLAIKLGSFKDYLNIYGGGEMEWAFLMKEKWWDSHSRNGSKTKRTEWWPGNITTFLPSVFVGVQFPGGANLKFKYYMENFLNHNYGNRGATNRAHVVSDLTKYKQSNLFYIALTYQIKTAKIIQLVDSDYE
ncbi:MAG: hypothetical protein DRI95_08000 [Bacteroidetes bacterium]|nr:MAG: hypothetical protein DRI95_08000 [Bacteroidota bacterium]